MATNRETSRKIRLGTYTKRTKWAPFWTVIKAFGKGKRIHPARLTAVKRHWTRTKLNVKPKREDKSYIR
ncbi:MAG: hypothetical protein V1660_03285 [archaeon]